MKTSIKVFIILLFVCSVISAQKSKKIDESFNVSADQKIVLKAYPGMDVTVQAWDKQSVSFNLNVEVSCSDGDFEKEFIENFKIVEENTNSILHLYFEAPKHNGGWSFWDLLRLKFVYNISINVTGKIFVPKHNLLTADFSYSELKIFDLEEEFKLSGNGNEILLRNCGNLQEINNNYGDIQIENSEGQLNLETRSSVLKIDKFAGELDIKADYSDLYVNNIDGECKIGSRSGTIKIKDVTKDLDIHSPYSDMEINNIGGMTTIVTRSGNIYCNNVGGVKIDAPYSECDLSKITGTASDKMDVIIKSGNLNITDAKGDLNVDDSYSNFRLNNIGGNISIITQSSSIDAKNIRGDIEIEAQYSNIDFKKITANNVKISNKSNVTLLDLDKVPNNVKIISEYGEVKIRMPEGYEGTVDLTAEYSEIRTDIPVKIKKLGSSMIGIGSIGSESNNKIEISTMSGNINIITK
ncbi:MAG: DUF4097 family beta strand repeat protein [Melioribacteraceae bacterium]|nr:DUF4097 family beta strand repeat protein [Melioribacteraceae bacterium]